jgi:hypothetical protein
MSKLPALTTTRRLPMITADTKSTTRRAVLAGIAVTLAVP